MEKEAQPAQEAAPPVSEETPKGTIRGNIKYPWGIVKDAKVVVGEKNVLSDRTGNYELTALVPGSYSVFGPSTLPGL